MRSLVLLALLGSMAGARPASAVPAQDPGGAGAMQEISGRAMDADGSPLPGVPVALHRVGDGAGATVDASTTDDEGRFRFALASRDSALYFVAMRYQDRLYIGPPARGGEDPITHYALRADPANEAGAVASALSGGAGSPPAALPPAQAGRGAGGGAGGGAGAAPWLVAVLALVVAGIYLATAPGYRRRRQREALMELAGIEDRLAAGSDDPDRDQRRRQALRRQLAPHD